MILGLLENLLSLLIVYQLGASGKQKSHKCSHPQAGETSAQVVVLMRRQCSTFFSMGYSKKSLLKILKIQHVVSCKPETFTRLRSQRHCKRSQGQDGPLQTQGRFSPRDIRTACIGMVCTIGEPLPSPPAAHLSLQKIRVCGLTVKILFFNLG